MSWHQPAAPSSDRLVAYGKNTAGDIAATGTTFPTGTDALAADISFDADGVSDYWATITCAEWWGSTAGNHNIDAKLDGGQSSSIVSGDSGGTEQRSLFARGLLLKPSKGMHTVNARIYTSAGTLNLRADASFPLVVTVEKATLT